MSPMHFEIALDQFAADDRLVFELVSGERLAVFDREWLLNQDGVFSYIQGNGVTHFFDASSVSRVMGWVSPPAFDDPPYLYRNGRPNPPEDN